MPRAIHTTYELTVTYDNGDGRQLSNSWTTELRSTKPRNTFCKSKPMASNPKMLAAFSTKTGNASLCGFNEGKDVAVQFDNNDGKLPVGLPQPDASYPTTSSSKIAEGLDQSFPVQRTLVHTIQMSGDNSKKPKPTHTEYKVTITYDDGEKQVEGSWKIRLNPNRDTLLQNVNVTHKFCVSRSPFSDSRKKIEAGLSTITADPKRIDITFLKLYNFNSRPEVYVSFDSNDSTAPIILPQPEDSPMMKSTTTKVKWSDKGKVIVKCERLQTRNCPHTELEEHIALHH
ncbi:uncharacterized protein FOMMEDRAFT_28480 [Fomitiporia mediterranea MF3/22]|uniref:uncharacterized protein n=1 Tax=Fomitiporia mediterranea (strain MF3/22) TaxID=694068 RepID=UPI0004407664|nr:uncharacterized protein FOMMEDRAFT_28480 [Fomitiporia mediterranea MF3/22]EJD02811.1 hypothetical protein FOMMEDRAFT_28480 [Fomitiporia mediterranea MF3/22]